MGFFRSLAKLFATFPLDARTASRRAVRMDAISLSFHKEMAKEKEPKGRMPFRTPQRDKVASLSLCSSVREVEHLQLLRVRLKESRTHGSSSDVAFVRGVSFCLFPCNRQKFKQDEKAKVFAKLTHLGRALMRPRWGSFAELCFSAVLFQNGGRRSFQRRQPLVSFLATSWETPRSSVKAGTANARSSVSPATKLWEV